MTAISAYIDANIETIHFVTGFTSSVICLLFGVLLMLVRFSKNVRKRSRVRPLRYIAASNALGWAYIIIGVFSMILLYTYDVRTTEEIDFFPITGLIISISQIILFTVAVLALFNSRLLNKTIVFANIAPVFILLVMYMVFENHEQIQFTIRFALFIYYLMQLVVYTVAFVIERRRYLVIIEDYFDLGELYDMYSCRGIALIYLSAIGIGIWALASYFFTTLQQETLFIFCYTIFYVAVAVYYMRYSKVSSRIQDVTTPERWEENEDFSREEYKKEKVILNDYIKRNR